MFHLFLHSCGQGKFLTIPMSEKSPYVRVWVECDICWVNAELVYTWELIVMRVDGYESWLWWELIVMRVDGYESWLWWELNVMRVDGYESWVSQCCQYWPQIWSNWPKWDKSGTFFKGQFQCIEIDLKKSQICPIFVKLQQFVSDPDMTVFSSVWMVDTGEISTCW